VSGESIRFLVVTRIPDPKCEDPKEAVWNLAVPLPLYALTGGRDGDGMDEVRLFRDPTAMRVRVFELGEILIVDGDGREVAGRGRKPGKWGVELEEFLSLEAAVARARDVVRPL